MGNGSEPQPPYRLILDGLARGEVIPFLGAGASLPAVLGEDEWRTDNAWRFPLAIELARALADYTSYPIDAPHDLALVAQYFDVTSGRTPLARYLHDIFVCEHDGTQLHRFLADHMPAGIVITTNYDNLIERAFTNRAAGSREFDLVVHAIDAERDDRVWLLRAGSEQPELIPPAKLDVDGSERPLIYKMHGTADVRDPLPDQFLITEDDYVDFLSRMMRRKVLPAPVLAGLLRANVLFLGYGLGDWNVRVVLNEVGRALDDRVRNKHFVSWAIQHHVNAVDRAAWKRRNVELFGMTLVEFVDELERVESVQRAVTGAPGA